MSAQITSETDVTFRTHQHGRAGRDPLPPAGAAIAAVAEVHGGAWTSGNRTMNAAIARHLSANGIAVLTLDFRMPPEAAYPVTVTDVAAGVRWLQGARDRLGIAPGPRRPARHLERRASGLLAALRPHDERYAGGAPAANPDIAVDFAVLGWPVSDPLARYRMMRERGNERLMEAHHAFWAGEDQMAEGSPYDIVVRGDAQRLPSLLILQGTNDDNLTPDMQQRFVEAYRAEGRPRRARDLRRRTARLHRPRPGERCVARRARAHHFVYHS